VHNCSWHWCGQLLISFQLASLLTSTPIQHHPLQLSWNDSCHVTTSFYTAVSLSSSSNRWFLHITLVVISFSSPIRSHRLQPSWHITTCIFTCRRASIIVFMSIWLLVHSHCVYTLPYLAFKWVFSPTHLLLFLLLPVAFRHVYTRPCTSPITFVNIPLHMTSCLPQFLPLICKLNTTNYNTWSGDMEACVALRVWSPKLEAIY